MFKVSTAGGFITFDLKTRLYGTNPDSRYAHLFKSFKEADDNARFAVGILFGRANQHYDILISVSVIHISRRIYQTECEQSDSAVEATV